MRHSLLEELSALTAPALYERFDQARKAAAVPPRYGTGAADRLGSTSQYDRFVADMKAGGFRRLFEDKPVLLRLIATLTRQWIDSHARIRPAPRRRSGDDPPRHSRRRRRRPGRRNRGRSLRPAQWRPLGPASCGFEDGARVVYKPKDLRLDVAWHALIERFNRSGAPVELRPVRAIARDGYGWTEFIDARRMRRRGRLPAIFPAGRRLARAVPLLSPRTDMHQENMIAAGDHPVPIDLETILQPTADEHKTEDPEAQAFDAAIEMSPTRS